MSKPDCYRGTTNGDCGARAIDSVMCACCDFAMSKSEMRGEITQNKNPEAKCSACGSTLHDYDKLPTTCVSCQQKGIIMMSDNQAKEALKRSFENRKNKLIASTCLVEGCKCDETESYNSQLSISNRGSQWLQFSTKILNHIENYTVPQYGDAPDDPVETWDATMCLITAEKYMNRRGKAQRQGEEKLDILKTVHFLQLAFDKREG